MPVRLDWEVGPGGDEAVTPGLPPAQVWPRRAQRRLRLTPRLLTLYLVALLGAGGLGFGLGRWSEAQQALWAELDRQVGLETVAWRENDPTLLAETLDPTADPLWQQVVVARLATQAPLPDYSVRVVAVSLVAPDLARVQVRLRTAHGEAVEDRLYRAVGSRWYRSPGDQSGQSQP